MARIFMIDDDPLILEDWLQRLKGKGYEVSYLEFDEDDTYDHISEITQTQRPHVSLVDLQLQTKYSDDRSGFEVVDRYLQSSQNILYSGYINADITREALLKHRVKDLVSKGDATWKVLDKVAEAAAVSCIDGNDNKVRWPEGLASKNIVVSLLGEDTDAPFSLVDDIIHQLFPGYETVKLTYLIGNAQTSSANIRQHSCVFKATPFKIDPESGDLVQEQPLFIKIARSTQITTEVKNYEQHVDRKLQAAFAPQKREHRIFWDLGGVSFESVALEDEDQNSEAAIITFRKFFERKEDPKDILLPLRFFFKAVWNAHYIMTKPAEKSLLEVYSDSLGRNLIKRFEERLLTAPVFPGVDAVLPDPGQWVLAHQFLSKFGCAHMAVVHGDLHGDNLFVSNQFAWVLDFERTGMGHAAWDFAELEMDIITRLTPWEEVSLLEYYDYVWQLIKLLLNVGYEPTASIAARPVLMKSWHTIAGLRDIARDLSVFTKEAEYLWAMLLHCLYVASAKSITEPVQQRALLLSAVICRYLDESHQP